MTKLSVNINKIATLRNSRGGDLPSVVQFAKDVQRFGAQGVTIHPRPDERHIRYQDARDLKSVVHTEYNIEGNPIPKFIDLVLETKPTQVTLVPDSVNVITSNAGWDTIKNKDFLIEVISEFKRNNIRTSIFIDPDLQQIEGAKATGTDRIEIRSADNTLVFLEGTKNLASPIFFLGKTAGDPSGLGTGTTSNINRYGPRASGSTVEGIRQSELRKIEVIVPEKVIMEKASLIFRSTIEKKAINSKQIQTLIKTRDMLLPKLMSGQLRVNEYKE